MRWQVRQGDILDISADVLVCSANVFLTLSGGVGGAFVRRYGNAMQEALQRYLEERALRHVEQGDVVTMASCGSSYRAVLHAVAVDGFYDTTPQVVSAVLTKSLRLAAALSVRSVALTAVATGYGRLTMTAFAQGLAPLLRHDFPPLERVTIGLWSALDVEELLTVLPQLEVVGFDDGGQ